MFGGGMKTSGSFDLGFDFEKCADTKALSQSDMKGRLEECIRKAGFTLISSIFHVFKDGGKGYSFLAIIGESHVAVHSWPEKQAVEVTLHYCNFTQDNSEKAEKLISLYKELFRPEQVNEYDRRTRL
jgi:S-adenosylmethionine/arginine decarboxylase-like enzyme